MSQPQYVQLLKNEWDQSEKLSSRWFMLHTFASYAVGGVIATYSIGLGRRIVGPPWVKWMLGGGALLAHGLTAWKTGFYDGSSRVYYHHWRAATDKAQ